MGSRRVYTDLAVLVVTPSGLFVRELVDGLTGDGLQMLTGAPLLFADDLRVLAPAASVRGPGPRPPGLATGESTRGGGGGGGVSFSGPGRPST